MYQPDLALRPPGHASMYQPDLAPRPPPLHLLIRILHMARIFWRKKTGEVKSTHIILNLIYNIYREMLWMFKMCLKTDPPLLVDLVFSFTSALCILIYITNSVGLKCWPLLNSEEVSSGLQVKRAQCTSTASTVHLLYSVRCTVYVKSTKSSTSALPFSPDFFKVSTLHWNIFVRSTRRVEMWSFNLTIFAVAGC